MAKAMGKRTAKTATDAPATRARSAAKAASPRSAKIATPAAMPQVTMTLTHDQIAQKAYEIWLAKGCPNGHDEENWREAQAMLSGGRPA